jgi:hypothetical protein
MCLVFWNFLLIIKKSAEWISRFFARNSSPRIKSYRAPPTPLGYPGVEVLSPGSPLGEAPVPIVPGVDVLGAPG